MDITRFKEVVSSFLDSADQLEWSKGTVVAQVGSEMIAADLRTRDGSLYVIEGGKEQLAEKWIINRLAMLDLLADRILASVDDNPAFVAPSGEIVDEIERVSSDTPVPVDNAATAVYEFLERRPGGTCSVLYLTSDAGEGKTTLIEHLARHQADEYRNRRSDWLLVPVGLGGRPFLRFDDVIMAAFMNQLRFQRLYYDAFLQLVRMGVLVPALDGFEEIFVETSEGDAVTSLGTLIGQLGGEGTLLIAARKAFFEFRRLETQAKLLDTLPDVDVGFGRVSIHRWGSSEFLEYCRKRGFAKGAELYDALSTRVQPEHPLLTRAVLVRRIVDLATTSGPEFVKTLSPETSNEFKWLVLKVLEREATEKWINKFGDPPTPLLTVDEHQELLRLVAEEMWISKAAVLPERMIESIAEIYADQKRLAPQAARQVRDRLKHHALLSAVGPARKEIAFDHDHFRQFFLGQQLARHVMGRDISDLRKIFRVDYLPDFALDTTAAELREEKIVVESVLKEIANAAAAEGSAGFVRENAGALLIRLVESTGASGSITDVAFPNDSLKGRRISGVAFARCYFQPTSVDHAELRDCRFEDCDFERLEYEQAPTVEDCSFSGKTRVHALSLLSGGELVDIYDPGRIDATLMRLGFSLPLAAPELAKKHEEPQNIDERLRIAEKAVQTFQRTTHVGEGTFKLRLSINSRRFFDEVLPDLQKAGVLQVAKVDASGRKYRLGMPMSRIAEALATSCGDYEQFLNLASRTET
jgi:hypothetical protein